MSSRASVERLHLEHRTKFRPRRGHHCGSSHFFGLDAEEMGPKGQIFGALAVLAPVALSGVLLVALAPGFWWIFTTHFWVVFPAFGLLARGVSGFSKRRAEIASACSTGERELLKALFR